MLRTKNKGGNKLGTYNKLKQHFIIEPYLLAIEDKPTRAAYTKLRLSSHPLNIETQRGQIHDPNQRLCQMCNLNKTEDEFHFLTVCPKYTTGRDKLLNTIDMSPRIKELSGENLAIWLLTNEEKNVCKAVGKFILESFQIRKSPNTQND